MLEYHHSWVYATSANDGMVIESLEIKGQTLVDETNLFHMMEQKLLHF